MGLAVFPFSLCELPERRAHSLERYHELRMRSCEVVARGDCLLHQTLPLLASRYPLLVVNFRVGTPHLEELKCFPSCHSVPNTDRFL